MTPITVVHASTGQGKLNPPPEKKTDTGENFQFWFGGISSFALQGVTRWSMSLHIRSKDANCTLSTTTSLLQGVSTGLATDGIRTRLPNFQIALYGWMIHD